MDMKTFAEGQDDMLFYGTCIWCSMKAHVVVSEFSSVAFGSHVLISALFTCFLVEQTGKSLGAGVDSTVKLLEADIKKVKNDLTSNANAINGRLDKMAPEIRDLKAALSKKKDRE